MNSISEMSRFSQNKKLAEARQKYNFSVLGNNEKELIRVQLRKNTNNIKQLADMVNTYSAKLGLGKKVRPEDFYEDADKILKELGS